MIPRSPLFERLKRSLFKQCVFVNAWRDRRVNTVSGLHVPFIVVTLIFFQCPVFIRPLSPF